MGEGKICDEGECNSSLRGRKMLSPSAENLLVVVQLGIHMPDVIRLGESTSHTREQNSFSYRLGSDRMFNGTFRRFGKVSEPEVGAINELCKREENCVYGGT